MIRDGLENFVSEIVNADNIETIVAMTNNERIDFLFTTIPQNNELAYAKIIFDMLPIVFNTVICKRRQSIKQST